MGSYTLAIIPARGGSKGIPKKNIQLLSGKPLLAYSIESALATPSINRVIVSTDDVEIGAVARQYGAEVIWRPADISGDSASSESALLHVMDCLRDTDGYEPDLVVFLQATSPLRAPDDIQNAIATLQHEGADSLFSACRVEGFIWRLGVETLTPINYNPLSRPRRQELGEAIFEENGSVYIFKPWVLYEFNSRLGGKIGIYPMPRTRSFQIDSPDDLELIEQLLALQQTPSLPEMTGDLSAIRLIVLDFDGVMTDNRALVDQDGKEAVLIHRGDGWGVARLKDAGVDIVVLSTETNPVVAARCRKLDIDCIQGCSDKLAALQEIATSRQVESRHVAYVGNDLNDLTCMGWVGIPIAVADAVPEICRISRLATSRSGGHGAVRELAEWILASRR